MKIRTDFVTNSSSSSFVCVHISGTKLISILKEYDDVIESLEANGAEIDDNSLDISGEEAYTDFSLLESKRHIIDWFIDFISNLCDDAPMLDDLVSELEENKKEIINTITELDVQESNEGWGEDTDRYDYPYEDKFIRKHLKLSKDEEITDEIMKQFFESVSDQLSLRTTSVSYDGKKIKKSESIEFIPR